MGCRTCTLPPGILAPPQSDPRIPYPFARTTSPYPSPLYKDNPADVYLEILSRLPQTRHSRRSKHTYVGVGRDTCCHPSPHGADSRHPCHREPHAHARGCTTSTPPGQHYSHPFGPPRVPKSACPSCRETTFPTRGPPHPSYTRTRPRHSLSTRFSSSSPPTAARTPETRNSSLVPRRASDPRTRASTPKPADLQWACKHRSCASIRPPPTRADPGPQRPATPEHAAPSPGAEEPAAAYYPRAFSGCCGHGRPS
jgi:hypothetical protein